MVQSTEARARPFALPASFCWPPARADTARRDSKRASSSPGVKESVKERFDATWPVARSDLCSWRPCVEERFFAPEDSFKVFNYTMASEPEVPVPATEPGTRFRGRDVRVSPWTILSRRPQDSIGALKGQRMSYQQRVEVPEKSRSFEVRMPQVRAESPAASEPSSEASGREPSAPEASVEPTAEARPRSEPRRPRRRKVKRSNSRTRLDSASRQVSRCGSRSRLRGVQRSRALQLMTERPEGCEAEDAVQEVPAELPRKGERKPIKLLLSAFEGRAPVLLFDYHPAVGKEREMDPDRVVATYEARSRTPAFCHATCVHRYNAVLNSFRQAGLPEVSAEDKWTLLWGGTPRPESLREFLPFQKTNHFPASWHLGRKDLLWRNIRGMQQRCFARFDIMPQTFLIPSQFKLWSAAREMDHKAIWIWKPINSSCGRGIKLLPPNLSAKELARLEKKQGLVQRYVERPLLLDGRKFDLRLYVVVTSFDPLKAYLFQEGLVRLATERYSLSPHKLNKRTMHLTNYSVNKQSAKYIQNQDGKVGPAKDAKDSASLDLEEEDVEEDAGDCPTEADGTDLNSSISSESDEDVPEVESKAKERASKWSLQDLQEYFRQKDLDYDSLMLQIKELVVKTLIATETPIVSAWHNGANYRGVPKGVGPNQTCFELYGCDVLVDAQLRPWLLEVNTCPSLSSSSPLDKRLKTQLVADMLTLVGVGPQEPVRKMDLKARFVRSHTVERIMSETTRLRDLGEVEWSTILEAQDEYLRRGSFERIFPTETLDFQDDFRTQRYANCILAKWLREGGENCFLPGREDLRPDWLPEQLFSATC